jgi:hypothetical protein
MVKDVDLFFSFLVAESRGTLVVSTVSTKREQEGVRDLGGACGSDDDGLGPRGKRHGNRARSLTRGGDRNRIK